jgi:hypothetical protein
MILFPKITCKELLPKPTTIRPNINKGKVWMTCGRITEKSSLTKLLLTWSGSKYDPRVEERPQRVKNNRHTEVVDTELESSDIHRELKIGPCSIKVTEPKDKPSNMAVFEKFFMRATWIPLVVRIVIIKKRPDGIAKINRKYPTPSCLPTGKMIRGICIVEVRRIKPCQVWNFLNPCKTPDA